MSFAHQLTEDLGELEKYLEQGPQGDNKRLANIAASMKHVESEKSLAMIQMLGTAVGKQRREHFLISSGNC